MQINKSVVEEKDGTTKITLDLLDEKESNIVATLVGVYGYPKVNMPILSDDKNTTLRAPFIIMDAYGLMNLDDNNKKRAEVIEIISFYSKIPGKGYGKMLIHSLIEGLEAIDDKDFLIVLKAQPMYNSEEEFEEGVKSGDFARRLPMLISYYENLGFMSINTHVCGFENSEGMAYIGNKLGKVIHQRYNKVKADNNKDRIEKGFEPLD